MTQKTLVTLNRTLTGLDPIPGCIVKVASFTGVFVRWDNREECTYRIEHVHTPESYKVQSGYFALTFKKSAIVSTQELREGYGTKEAK